jgi:hypothetical protein
MSLVALQHAVNGFTHEPWYSVAGPVSRLLPQDLHLAFDLLLRCRGLSMVLCCIEVTNRTLKECLPAKKHVRGYMDQM